MDLLAMLPRTAIDTHSKVVDLCARLAPGQVPIYIPINALPDAVVNECFGNVEKQITEHGGAIQYGWQIWETIPNKIIEAEFHAVWVDPTGIYHEITPKAMPVEKILFLPDPIRKYKGQQIDNFRIAVDPQDDLMRRFIKNAEDYFIASNKDDLANQHGVIIATPEMRKLLEEKEALSVEFINGLRTIYPTPEKREKVGRNDPCPCGSGKKYKKCHGN